MLIKVWYLVLVFHSPHGETAVTIPQPSLAQCEAIAKDHNESDSGSILGHCVDGVVAVAIQK